MSIQSFVQDQWVTGAGNGVELFNAVNSELIGTASTSGIDFAEVVKFAREHGGPALRKLTFHERANQLKAVAKYLLAHKESLYKISTMTGATRADSWVDIEGGIGTVFSYSGITRREFPNQCFHVEGNAERLSANGTFIGRHILTPKPGVAVHINAYNFPCWGMLEKIAPSLLAGMPVIVKPATVTCFLTEAMVRLIIESGILPRGSIQLLCGSTGNLLDLLDEQDVVTFTGSAATGQMLKVRPNIIANSIPFNMEADSLNCSILGKSVSSNDPEFALFIREVANEITTKAGQKCTAIRRAIVPRERLDEVADALKERLDKVTIGDPNAEGVRMGALAGMSQRDDVATQLAKLQTSSELIYGGHPDDMKLSDADAQKGAFFPPTLLHCNQPLSSEEVHAVEAFGPVTTLMPYDNNDEAIRIASLGRGSLVGSVISDDEAEVTELVLGAAAWHGRMLVLNNECAKESTGHGSPLAQLVHGGPGRAGGGEELGGSRAIKHYMQRTAVQGSPSMLTAITQDFNPGSRQIPSTIHPFRKKFEDLEIGETLITHKRTVTEADIVNFGCLSGDHFYAHFDETAVEDSLFGKRVAHGYFVISAAAGMFVDPAKGPVLANYGLDNLRFIEPVGIGDTIQVRLTVKQKNKKDKRDDDKYFSGVVIWDVEITNQHELPVALYNILTLVERAPD
ncbi:MAG: phenylacetic acid degradation bifunctional protein PaaZ [Gammaproteobacteria bacterium]